MRSFEFARKMVNGKPFVENNEEVKAYEKAEIPEYQTRRSAGADFFAAEDIEVPSIWKHLPALLRVFGPLNKINYFTPPCNDQTKYFPPTLIHTGIKASMEEDEVLYLYNRSGNPKKKGLILANGVGVIDADYYNNPDNDGEIMFAFYNIFPWDLTIKQGERIGQGVFAKYLRPTEGLRIKDADRASGFGSTGK